MAEYEYTDGQLFEIHRHPTSVEQIRQQKASAIAEVARLAADITEAERMKSEVK